jgi:hypothetical protein
MAAWSLSDQELDASNPKKEHHSYHHTSSPDIRDFPFFLLLAPRYQRFPVFPHKFAESRIIGPPIDVFLLRPKDDSIRVTDVS